LMACCDDNFMIARLRLRGLVESRRRRRAEEGIVE
jgi:hypothetical protein